MEDPVFELQSNVASTAAWLSRLGETRLRRIIYVSSGGTVYGPPRLLPVSEDHPLNPISVYGIAKLACEKLIAMYSELAGIDYRIARPSNAYGEGQPVDRNQGILGVLLDRIKRGKAIEIWGYGEGMRDYIHVDDVVESLLALLTHSGPSRVFNVSTGVGHSVLNVIQAFRSRAQDLPEVVHLPARGFDVPDNILDNSRLKQETGWWPKVSLDAGIDRLLAGDGATRSDIEIRISGLHINAGVSV
jgi:UDP-glucose 4-epimerase